MDITIFIIADIHLGVLDSEYQWQNLLDHFFFHIKKKKPNIIIIDGDIMHEKVAVNSSTALIFQMFIDELINTGSHVIIVEGTRSHDDNQIKIFSHRINDKFRIYSKVTVDNILGIKCLFIPEEYMTNPDEYYESYLKPDTKYDFVFGHGMFDHIAYVSKKKQINRKLIAPMWSFINHFKKIIYGKVLFGHIHTRDNLTYVGSFGRYAHGEEEPKGFTSIIYNTEKHKIIKEEFIENTGAKIFKSINESDLPNNRDDLINRLKDLSEKSFRLRIRINREISPERLSDIISFTKSNLNSSIDKVYERKLNKSSKNDDKLSGSKVVLNKYEGMDIVDATIEFVFENRGIKLDREHIIKIINSDG